MKPRTLILGLILGWGLATAAALRAAEPTDQAYRDSLDAYRKSLVANEQATAAAEHADRVRTIVGAAVIAGLVLFVIIPLQRAQKAYAAKSIDILIQNQRTLEEIRDLLKKPIL
jgi:large-conductance mechanosensitive channel